MTQAEAMPPFVNLLETLLCRLSGSLGHYQSFMGSCDWERRSISVSLSEWLVAARDSSTPAMAHCIGLWQVHRSGYVDDSDYDGIDSEPFKADLMLGGTASDDHPMACREATTAQRAEGRITVDAIDWHGGSAGFRFSSVDLPPGLAGVIAEGARVVFQVSIGGERVALGDDRSGH